LTERTRTALHLGHSQAPRPLRVRPTWCHELVSNQCASGFNRVLYLLSYRGMAPRRGVEPLSSRRQRGVLPLDQRGIESDWQAVKESNPLRQVLETRLRPAPDL